MTSQRTKPKLLDEVKKTVIAELGRSSLMVGILLVILGSLGIILPRVMSFAIESFIATLMILGGIFWSYHSFKQRPINFMHWLKPVLLFVTGGLMLIYRHSGVDAVGLLIAIYLLLDSFGTFGLAHSHYPMKGWEWMVFNGIITLLLALLFLIGWPSTSFWLVGLYIGISLLFDGWALVSIGWLLIKAD